MLITSSRQHDLQGKRLDAIAAARGTEPVEAAIQIIRTAGDQSVASFNMNAKDIDAFMRADFVTTCSDGSDGHPRKYGTFPRKIRDYVLDRPVITMERAIAAGSAQPARDLQIAERGKLTVGWFADVIVFDPGTIRDLATYAEPERPAAGMRWVFVNGKAAVEDGRPTNALAGRALRLAR
jgi:N-acyl-D-aspartate/D-glutamate deacylase